MEIQSKYQSFLTLDYIVNESENKLFDRKSSRIKPSDLAPIISAFANAEGGTVVIGIDDKTKAIESPGKLPSIVTLDNIKETRYSRNPRIARILTDFGWVRELNEGVKRIYSNMEKYFLDDPVYSEPGLSVRLVLKNNIVMRNLRRKDKAFGYVGEDVWARLDNLDHEILAFLSSNISVSRTALVAHTKKSLGTVGLHLNDLIKLGVVQANGSVHDPTRTYSIIYKED